MAKFNIIDDYDWTSVPRGSGLRKNAPKLLLLSYKINSSESLKRIRSYANVVSLADADSFYDNLYGGISSPEDYFYIPFLGDNVRSFSNEYGDTFQSSFLGNVDSVLTGGSKLVGEVASYVGSDTINAVKTAASNITSGKKSFGEAAFEFAADVKNGNATSPGSYIETPKLYQYAQNDSGLEVSFVLSNTINSDYKKNTELVNHLQKINRPKRENSVIMEPPRIYKVKLHGIRFIRWAYCSNFSLNLLGAKRMIDGKIIPEGYMVSMTLTSLTTEVSNFMDKI